MKERKLIEELLLLLCLKIFKNGQVSKGFCGTRRCAMTDHKVWKKSTECKEPELNIKDYTHGIFAATKNKQKLNNILNNSK